MRYIRFSSSLFGYYQSWILGWRYTKYLGSIQIVEISMPKTNRVWEWMWNVRIAIFFGLPTRYPGFALTNMDLTRIVHLAMVGESLSWGNCIHKVSNSRPRLSDTKPLTTWINPLLVLFVFFLMVKLVTLPRLENSIIYGVQYCYNTKV